MVIVTSLTSPRTGFVNPTVSSSTTQTLWSLTLPHSFTLTSSRGLSMTSPLEATKDAEPQASNRRCSVLRSLLRMLTDSQRSRLGSGDWLGECLRFWKHFYKAADSSFVRVRRSSMSCWLSGSYCREDSDAATSLRGIFWYNWRSIQGTLSCL